jgi:hypothetical protein
MFVLGHLGVGSKLCGPWAAKLPRRWLLFGCILPDVIDKPLYYSLSLATGRRAAELGLISGTRTFGHTGLLLLTLTLVSVARRSTVLAAISFGMASHLLLDNLGDAFLPLASRETLYALFFPFLGVRFPVFPYAGPGEHIGSFLKPYVMAGEALGAAILFWDGWKIRHHSEITQQSRRKKT